MSRPIDWTRYPAAPHGAKRGRARFVSHRCDVCNRAIVDGDLARRGPRGARWAHERCTPDDLVDEVPR
jgi:hypothetical protein